MPAQLSDCVDIKTSIRLCRCQDKCQSVQMSEHCHTVYGCQNSCQRSHEQTSDSTLMISVRATQILCVIVDDSRLITMTVSIITSVRATQILCVIVDDSHPITMTVYVITSVRATQILCVIVDDSHPITMTVYVITSVRATQILCDC